MLTKKLRKTQVLQFKNISETDCFHFTSTSVGGISDGSYTSLNLGSETGDKKENLEQNWNIFCEAIQFPKNDIYTPHQTHENKIFVVDKEFLTKTEVEQKELMYGYDAIITNIPQVCIFVETADCVPIQLYDTKKKVLASIHAGWKGTVSQIAKLTIEKMQKEFASNPSDILAGIGPSISQEHFEVGEEVGKAFAGSGYKLDDISYRNKNTGKLHIDLWEANRIQLVESGIKNENIEIAELCTYSNHELFFSARRQTIKSGRIITGGYIQ